MNTTQSKISKHRQKYASNQAFILKTVNLSELEYYKRVYETGIFFLELQFPSDFDYQQKFATDKLYWKWWKTEWKLYEDKMIKDFNRTDYEIKWEMWIFKTVHLSVHSKTANSFHNNFSIILKAIKI